MPKKAAWKTQKYYHGPSGAHRRAVYKAMGYTTDDMKRPLIAIVNTWGEVCPGHYNLDHLTRTWAAELQGTGVRLNSVDPGEMDTEMKRASEPDGDAST